MRCCGFDEGIFLKVSSLSAIMQKFRVRGYAHSMNWLRDQPFEQGMTITKNIHIEKYSLQVVKRLGFMILATKVVKS